ncbi:MAG TPA: thioredoxin-dependent thiol peroxidase [bacterium]|nr:thioredoxin-dependent thiol peroxidase [bacterium]
MAKARRKKPARKKKMKIKKTMTKKPMRKTRAKRVKKRVARKRTVKKAMRPAARKVAVQETVKTLTEGLPAPDFRLQSDDANWVSLSDLRGKKVVLYFYPKDDTPGCTKEACAFRDGISQIQALGAAVYGVSVDDTESHRRFKEKYNLNFPLLADTDKKTVQDYGVWKEKNMYGRTYMGIERTTFLIDADGKIQKIFPKVDVEVHYDEVLKALG